MWVVSANICPFFNEQNAEQDPLHPHRHRYYMHRQVPEQPPVTQDQAHDDATSVNDESETATDDLEVLFAPLFCQSDAAFVTPCDELGVASRKGGRQGNGERAAK